MSTVSPKHALFEQLALVARSLGNPHRLELLEHLAQGERSVEALAERIGLSVANASQHLQQLRRAGLVANRREARFIHYRLADEGVVRLVSALRDVAERNLAEIDRILRGYFAERDGLEPVTRGELIERARDGLVTVLDVRPADEFALGHLPGAVNVPLAELATRLAELDPAARSSPTAAAPTACCPSRRSRRSAPAASRPAAWRKAIPNGARPGSRSSRRPRTQRRIWSPTSVRSPTSPMGVGDQIFASEADNLVA